MSDYMPEPGARSRKGRPHLTPEQQALAEDLLVRALALRAASDGELSIREAIDLAAAQLGLETPHSTPERAADR